MGKPVLEVSVKQVIERAKRFSLASLALIVGLVGLFVLWGRVYSVAKLSDDMKSPLARYSYTFSEEELSAELEALGEQFLDFHGDQAARKVELTSVWRSDGLGRRTVQLIDEQRKVVFSCTAIVSGLAIWRNDSSSSLYAEAKIERKYEPDVLVARARKRLEGLYGPADQFGKPTVEVVDLAQGFVLRASFPVTRHGYEFIDRKAEFRVEVDSSGQVYKVGLGTPAPSVVSPKVSVTAETAFQRYRGRLANVDDVIVRTGWFLLKSGEVRLVHQLISGRATGSWSSSLADGRVAPCVLVDAETGVVTELFTGALFPYEAERMQASKRSNRA